MHGDRLAMDQEKDRGEWSFQGSRLAEASGGAIRIALLFGSAAVALALIVAPIADRKTRGQIGDAGFVGLDRTATGSIGAGSTYTVRRSVLQPTPNSVCIIGQNGVRSGACN